MAITVDWSTTPWLITVPKSDLTLDTGTKYNLLVDTFWTLLSDFSDNAEAIPRPILYTRIPATASTPSITEVDGNYYEIQFEDGLYSVNIINGNTNVRDVEVKNQVSVNTNNTTGFIDQSILVYGTFNSGIYWDDVNGKTSITDTNIDGNEANPLKNLSDVITQAVNKVFTTIYVVANATVTNAISLDTYSLIGKSRTRTRITFVNADTGDIIIRDAHIEGSMSGGANIEHCIIGPAGISGIGCTVNETVISNTLVEGNITIRADNTQPVTLENCGSFDSNITVLDVNGTSGNIAMQNMSDRWQIDNLTNAATAIHISSAAGCELFMTASCTNAALVELHGNIFLVDTSSLSIDNDTTHELVWSHTSATNVIAMITEMLKYDKNRTKINPIAFTLTIYDDDGTTPLKVFDLKDSAGVASVTEIYERLPQ